MTANSSSPDRRDFWTGLSALLTFHAAIILTLRWLFLA